MQKFNDATITFIQVPTFKTFLVNRSEHIKVYTCTRKFKIMQNVTGR